MLSLYKSAIFALANGAVHFDEFFFHKVILILTASFVFLFLRLTIDSHYYIFAPCSWQPATDEGHLIA